MVITMEAIAMKKTEKTVRVVRHTKLYVFLHWLIVFEVIVLLITGLNLTLGAAGSEVLPIFNRGVARALHITIGSIWLGTVIFFLYYFVISGEYFCFGLTNSFKSIDFFIKEIRLFLLGKKLKHPIRYDPEKKRYVQKIAPPEVVAWWLWFTLWVLIGITGLALVFPSHFGVVLRFSHWLIPSWVSPLSSTQILHGIIAVMFIVVMIIHAYASWYFGLLGSIITGEHDAPVVEKKEELSK